RIFASGDLDEYRISELLAEGAPIDFFGVGTKMATSSDAPYVDVVYKLSEIVSGGRSMPIMKLSEGKHTLPGRKQVFRSMKNGVYSGDTVGLERERLGGVPLLAAAMKNGRLVQRLPSLEQTRAHVADELSKLPESCKRIGGACTYKIRVSARLERLGKNLAKRLVRRVA
ncbi:MAG: nicotinate phosphoribosyltransferase, partial [Candidatus Micrarchaeia archaeon]